MNQWSPNGSGPALAKSWLACGLVGLLVLLSLGVAAHAGHSAAAGHHSCAACLMAHGGLIADGAIGAAVFLAVAALALPRLGEPLSASLFDLRLAPGRAPPA